MSEVTSEQLQKLENLKQYLKKMESVTVAYSSGVDSTFLLKVAKEVLGDKVLAVTAKSCVFPPREYQETVEFCKAEGVRHIVCEQDELAIEGFADNPPNRCYICKKALFAEFVRVSKEQGMNYVAEGSNMDDLGDYRPGLMAVAELGIKSPLRECELYKADIRALSHYLGLPTWEKPSYACLASRFVYGERITEEKLRMIDRAEQLLLDMGFSQMRVRIHGDMARIEVLPQELDKVMRQEIRESIVARFKEYGFSYVTLDMQGYRTGSMNERL